MFGSGRRKTRSQLMRDELSEGFDHLMQAATYAAGGVGATVGPRVIMARGYMSPTAGKVMDAASQGWGTTVTTLAPLAAAARQGAVQAGMKARKARRRSMAIPMRKKGPNMSRRFMLAGLLTAGAAAGAVGALVMRRRKQQRWEEYDPNQAMESTNMRAQAVANSARSTFDSAVDSAATGAQRIAAGVDRATDKMTSGTEKAAGKASSATANQADGAISGSPSGNRHS